MLQPASFNNPFIVGDVGLEKISVVPCETFTAAGAGAGAFKCLMMKSSSLITDFIGLLVDLVGGGVGGAAVVDGDAEVVESLSVFSSSTFPCSKSSMKLVKFDEIFLKSGITLCALPSDPVFVSVV